MAFSTSKQNTGSMQRPAIVHRTVAELKKDTRCNRRKLEGGRKPDRKFPEQNIDHAKFLRESLINYKAESQAKIRAGLLNLKLNLAQVENDLREEIKKNTICRQQLKKTDGFIRKLGQILHSYRQHHKFQGNDTEESSTAVPALEFLSTEINSLIHGHFTGNSKAPHAPALRVKSEDRDSVDYNFDFDPINENNEDIFGIGNTLAVSHSHSSNSEEEAQKPSIDQFSARPTKWTPDDATNVCELCRNDFTWYRWKHHCRMCGKLVCYDCSKYRGYVVGYSDNKVKVCRDCHTIKESLKKEGNQATSIYSGNFNPMRLKSLKTTLP